MEESPISTLVCDICGGSLAMDANGGYAVCESCGMKHSKERVKVMVQEIQGTVKIDGAVETVKGDAEKERLLKKAHDFMLLGDILNSLITYNEITKEYPNSTEAYEGILNVMVDSGKFLKYDQVYSRYHLICQRSDSLFMHKFCESLLSTYKSYTIFSKEPKPFSFFINKLENNILRKSLDYRFLRLAELSDELNLCFKKEGIENTRLVNEIGLLPNLLMSSDNKERFMGEDELNKYKCLFYYSDLLEYYCFKYYRDNDYTVHGVCIVKKVANTQELRSLYNRISQRLCQHCGGTFKGVFSKVCSRCGKPKDYK